MSVAIIWVIALLFSLGFTFVGIQLALRRSVAILRDSTHRIATGESHTASDRVLQIPANKRLGEAVRAMEVTLEAREQRLKTSEERFRQIAETITEAFWIADVDIQTMIYVSPAYERIWGRSCQSLYEEPRSFLSSVHPDDVERVLADWRAKENGEPFDHEYRIIRPDGSERWIWDRGYPVSNGGRRVLKYVGVAQDITERVKREHVHREIEERTRFALKAAGIGVWEANLKTGASFWSDTCELMHGLAPDTFGRTFEAFLDRIDSDDRADVRQEIEVAVRERRQAEFEYRTTWPDGSRHRILTTAHFFFDEAGVPVRGAGISVDVSERRSLEEQLRHAQRVEALGQFAGGIAHDFNNVLTDILGNADLMLLQLPPDDDRRADLVEITKAAERGAALTRQLLAFSRKQPQVPRILSIRDVLTDLVPMLRRLLGVPIELKISTGESGRIRADQTQIEQVIVNVVLNGRDAMPSGGSLTIETAAVALDHAYASERPTVRPGPYIRVAVRDTGHGMDAATRRRMFEPFFTTKPQGQATGLGLTMVHGIVERSGGYIDVQSELGCGTTVEVFLPVHEAPATKRRQPGA
jgi:PAS domain S-box-containing protein